MRMPRAIYLRLAPARDPGDLCALVRICRGSALSTRWQERLPAHNKLTFKLNNRSVSIGDLREFFPLLSDIWDQSSG